ncbi:MAG: (2Fe-2S)-binding protein [Gammaproteobacteria bacterium]|nr:(2Fe-2S)-binding protein [Gammaproteobacteria bacterium]
MFKRTHKISQPVRIDFEGREIIAQSGDSVAAALLAAGVGYFRESPASGTRRAPFCMIGNCFECLLEIDGQANRQGCMVAVREGMRVKMQRGAGDLDYE